MKILVLIGICSAVMAMPVVDETARMSPLDISDDPAEVVASESESSNSLQVQMVSEGKSHSGWSIFRRRRKNRRRRSVLRKLQTHLGCHGYYNRCMCGSSFTCWFKKKRGDKKLCSAVSGLCKWVGNNPKLMDICKQEAKNLLGSQPTGAKTAIKEIVPIVNDKSTKEKAAAREQIKKLITVFYNALSDTCKSDVKTLHTAMLKADQKTRGKLMKDFDQKCILPKLNAAKQEMALMLQLTNSDHQGWFLSVFIENILGAIFG